MIKVMKHNKIALRVAKMMDALIRLRDQAPRAREALIKEALLCQLSNTVKEVQLLHSHSEQVFSSSEAVSSLLAVLEAIFLHGLKRGLLRLALKSVSGVEDTKPQPSFWQMVRNYTHKHSLQTISSLSQITTDVGRSRVWIRMAVNEAELTSYLRAMERDRRPLVSRYDSVAFLRDRDTCDTACKLLDGIVAIPFRIPTNSSILNIWSNEPLMLCGLWSPSIKTPVSAAVDVAEGIPDDYDDTCSIKTSSSVTTLSTVLALDENQALRMILETPIATLENDMSSMLVQEERAQIEKEEQEMERRVEPLGNKLANNAGWSSAMEGQQQIIKDDQVEPRYKNQQVEEGQKLEDNDNDNDGVAEVGEPIMVNDAAANKSFTKLLESYGTPPKQSIDYRGLLQLQTDNGSPSPEADNVDKEYEFLSVGQSTDFDEKLFKIAREKGLRRQKYNCAGCQLSIGLNLGEARYCYFTGEYFCSKCHFNETSVIPSRLVYNWDHNKYPVCSAVSSFINDLAHKPLINIKQINNKLYNAVDEMKELRVLRQQLNMLRFYLMTCREPVLADLQKKMWPREYIYEHIHLYSINDMVRVPGGAMAAELRAVITSARTHVLTCWLCSQKGFICEVCKNPKVIYPFDSTTTYRCSKCQSVFHGTCLASSSNCPKCKRLQSRLDLSNEHDNSDSDSDDR